MKASRIILGLLALPFGAAAVSIALISLKPAVPGGGGGPEPGERSLITWAEISATHQGTFIMPDEWGYSEGIHAQLSNGNIIVSGPTIDGVQQAAGVASLPGTLNGSEATQVGSFVDPSNGLQPSGFSGETNVYQIGGMLEVGSRLYYTKHQWYNANGTDWESIGYNSNYAGGAANAVGMWDLSGEGVHSQRVAGQMAYAPEAVITDGYHFVAGQQAAAGAANGRWGPNMFAIQVDDGETAPGTWLSKPLIYHPDTLHKVLGWWIGDRSVGVWIETDNREGVLFLVTQQYGGDTWYGAYNLVSPPDPYSTDGGYHSNAYRLQAWLYDPADLMEVYNGTMNAWELEPYEKTTLITLAKGSSSGSETHFSSLLGVAYQWNSLSLRDGRLIVMRRNASHPNPGGHVFDLNEIE